MNEYLSPHNLSQVLNAAQLKVLFNHKVDRAVHRQWASPSKPADRLTQYREWTAAGLCDSVRDAAAAVAAARPAEHQAVRHDVTDAWRARRSRVFAINRKIVLAGDPSCVYCGAPATNADHVIPERQRGSGHYTNLVPSCRSCNLAKGGRTPEQWRAGEPRTKTGTLTGSTVTEIRQRIQGGERRDVLAEEFHVSLSTIAALVRRRTWKDVP